MRLEIDELLDDDDHGEQAQVALRDDDGQLVARLTIWRDGRMTPSGPALRGSWEARLEHRSDVSVCALISDPV